MTQVALSKISAQRPTCGCDHFPAVAACSCCGLFAPGINDETEAAHYHSEIAYAIAA